MSDVDMKGSSDMDDAAARDLPVTLSASGGVSLNRTALQVPTITVNVAYLVIETWGYAVAGDGGGAAYKRVSTEPTHPGKIHDSSGAWFELLPTEIDIRSLGATAGPSGSANVAIEQACEIVHARGGGIVSIPAGLWYLDNKDAPLPAVYSVTIIEKDNVSIRGAGIGATYLKVRDNSNIGPFVFNSCHNLSIRDMTIDGNRPSMTGDPELWQGKHGIKLSVFCVGFDLQNVLIKDTCGYGLGAQNDYDNEPNGFIDFNVFNLEIDTPNNDGIDIKNRTTGNRDLQFTNITVRGVKNGHASFDIRGIATVNGLQILGMNGGGDGIRFREGLTPQPGGMYSSLTNFYVDMAGSVNACGVNISNPYVAVSNGVVVNAKDANGLGCGIATIVNAHHCVVSNVVVTNSSCVIKDEGDSNKFVNVTGYNCDMPFFGTGTNRRMVSGPTQDIINNLEAGTAAAPALRFGTDTAAGFYRYAANTVAYAVGGGVITSFDSLGINVQSQVTLPVSGLIRTRADNGSYGLLVHAQTTSTRKVSAYSNPNGVIVSTTIGGANVLTMAGETTEIMRQNTGGTQFSVGMKPLVDNVISCGQASQRWSVVYAATSTINTSDAREKRVLGLIDDTVLDAVGDVDLVAYKFLDAVKAKGDASARIHFGILAQDLEAAFRKRGLDPAEFAVWCQDAVRDEDGNLVVDEEGKPAWRFGVRYDEFWALSTAWQRRELRRLAARLVPRLVTDPLAG